MRIFSFKFLFVLNNTRIPSPLPVKTPAIIFPKLIMSFKYHSVMITLLAQLGIRPIRLLIKYEK